MYTQLNKKKMIEALLSPLRELTKRHYDELGVEKLNVKLDPNQPITELKLSKRLVNVLLKNDINNVKDIYDLSTTNLISMIGLGNQLVTELERFRYQYQLGKFYND